MTDPFTRDELGRFSSSSPSPNGGGPSIAQPVELPETRASLLKFATSKPSKAPSMSGNTAPKFPGPLDSDAAFAAATKNSQEGDLGGMVQEHLGGALRAGGYGENETSGMAHPALSTMYTAPAAPAPSPASADSGGVPDFGGVPGSDLGGMGEGGI